MQASSILERNNAGGNSDQEPLAFFNDTVIMAAVAGTVKGIFNEDVGLPTVAEAIRHDEPTAKQLIAEFTLPRKHGNKPPKYPANMDETQATLLSPEIDPIANHDCSKIAEPLTKDTRSTIKEISEHLEFAQKGCFTEEEIGADQFELKGDDRSEEQVHSEDLLAGPKSESITSPTTQRQAISLINIPIDIRRLVYDEFKVPITKTIHLTHSPETTVFEVRKPDRHSVSKNVLNLFLVCRQVSDELADILYGKNTFVIMPGEHNYNTPTNPDALSNSRIWLAHQRLQTRQKVKELRLFLDFSLQARMRNVIVALSEYPEVQIAVQPLATSKLRARLQLEHVCASIQRARIHARKTAWSNSGNPEVGSILARALSDALVEI